MRHAVGVFVDVIRLSPARFHVTLAHLEPVADVAAGLAEDKGRAGIAVQVRVNQRRGRAGAVFRVEDARQLLVLDLDQLAGQLSQFRRFSGHSGHRLADKAHAVDGKGWPVGQVKPRQPRIVGAGDHDAHAGQRPGLAGVDARDEAVGNRAALQPAVQHVRPELHVVHVQRGAGDLGIALDAREGLPDDGGFLECHWLLPWFRFGNQCRFAETDVLILTLLPTCLSPARCKRAASNTASTMRV